MMEWQILEHTFDSISGIVSLQAGWGVQTAGLRVMFTMLSYCDFP